MQTGVPRGIEDWKDLLRIIQQQPWIISTNWRVQCSIGQSYSQFHDELATVYKSLTVIVVLFCFACLNFQLR